MIEGVVISNIFAYYYGTSSDNEIMAKQSAVIKVVKPKVKRPNVHAKSKTSQLKSSKLYKKKYKGQGR